MTNIIKNKPKHVLFSVLNWGLGHATRSIPIIEALVERGIDVTIASDGLPLILLKKHFKHCRFLDLPPLDITYSDRGSQTLAAGKSIVKNSSWYVSEREVIKDFLAKNKVDAIISDNRPTAHHAEIHSVYITHQLKVRAGFLTHIASLGHLTFYKRYHEIWAPDIDEGLNLSGDLSRVESTRIVKFIGPLSDLKPTNTNPSFDVGVVLSGPEPQRTILEEKIIEQLAQTKMSVCLLRGTETELHKTVPSNWKVQNVAKRKKVQKVFDECEIIIARAGYSTLMDLYSYPKPAVLFPTPGQPEQQYLASLPLHNGNFAIANQNEFQILESIELAKKKHLEFHPIKIKRDWDALFKPFLG